MKCKKGRSQRPKKNDIFLVMTPSAGAFVVGASAFKWKQVLCRSGFTHTCRGVRVCVWAYSTSVTHPGPQSLLCFLKPGDSLLNLMRLAEPCSLQDGCPHLSARTPGGQVGAHYCSWQVESNYHDAGKALSCEGEEPRSALTSSSICHHWLLSSFDLH